MPNIGPLEIAIVLVIALIVFGPKRLPDLGRSAGKGLREFKESISGDKNEDEHDDPAAMPSQAAADVNGTEPKGAERHVAAR